MQLHLRTWGDPSLGQTAVLIHGLAGSAATWDETAPALVARGYRCIAPDLPGHGLSPNPDRTFDIPSLVDDVAASVPATPDLLIGFSLGGGIALLAAGAGKLTSKRLVLIDPGLRAPISSKRSTTSEAGRSAPATPVPTRWGTLRRALASSAPWDARPALDILAGHTPILVVLAGRRSNVSPTDTQAFEEKLGRGSVVTIPGASHAVHRSHLAEFLTALDCWLAGETSPPNPLSAPERGRHVHTALSPN